MRARILLHSIFMGVLVTACLGDQGGFTPTPQGTGAQTPTSPPDSASIAFEVDWVVTGTSEMSHKTITLAGDLVVSDGGSLDLQDSTLIMGAPGGRPPGIEIREGGSLTIKDSLITSSSPEIGYDFIFQHGSSGSIEQSTVEYVAPNDLSLGSGAAREHANLGALTVLADGFILRDSIIRNAVEDARGILIAEARDVVIERNEIAGNPRDGIRLVDCQNVTIRGNRIHDNGTYGLKFMHCHDALVENNLISGNAHSDSLPYGTGVYLEFGTTATMIRANQILDSGGHGVVITGQSNDNVVEDNQIRGNQGYGVEIYDCTNNLARGNSLSGNRLEGIHIESGSADNIAGDNSIACREFDGVVDDFEQFDAAYYYFGVIDVAPVAYSVVDGSSNDKSKSLRLDYTATETGCITDFYGLVGQDWSEYAAIGYWVLADDEIRIELEIGENDGDAWSYAWDIDEAGTWQQYRAPLRSFSRIGRSTGDGVLSLHGVGYYRFIICHNSPPESERHSVLFDHVVLEK
jgi:parallel beta-helix repeat protein